MMKRILLIEDNEDNRRIIRDLLATTVRLGVRLRAPQLDTSSLLGFDIAGPMA
jgi:hypothetical protein